MTDGAVIQAGRHLIPAVAVAVFLLALAACATEPPPCPPQCVGADLRGADLRGSDLTEADLTGAVLTRADLTRADLTGSVLIDVQGCDATGRLPGCTAAGSQQDML